MTIIQLKILHLTGLFILLGYTFYACAAAAETRKRVLMITGIASLLVLLTGGAMLGVEHLHFPAWAVVKLVCWLGLSALGGFSYRRRAAAPIFMIIAILLAITAVVMVYSRPS